MWLRKINLLFVIGTSLFFLQNRKQPLQTHTKMKTLESDLHIIQTFLSELFFPIVKTANEDC
jgi:hypothetical protein